MTTNDFIQEYFVQALNMNNDTGNMEFNYRSNVGHKEVDVSEINDTDAIHICCGKGHVMKITLAEIPDIIENGCPFCKGRVNNRYLNYSSTYESLGFVIEKLPKTFADYNNIKCELLSHEKRVWVEFNPWMINVNCLKVNQDRLRFTTLGRRKRDITKEICNLLDNIMIRAFMGQVYDNNLIVLTTERSREDFLKGDINNDDLVLVRCDNCGRLHMISDCRLAAGKAKCRECGEVILVGKAAKYSYLIDEIDYFDIDKVWAVRTEYGNTINMLRRHVKEKGVTIDEKCSNSSS